MKQDILHNIKRAAKQDFNLAQKCINKKQNIVTASIQNIRYTTKNNVVTATCSFDISDGSIIEAAINYETKSDGLYADTTISDVAKSILSAVSQSQPIMAADEDDAFAFDEFEEEETEISSDEESEGAEVEEEETFEDPEDSPNIQTDNNIAGHYIVECDRCQGIFISALTESDQVVDYISGVCPLCEKESDQYIKWVIHDVEF